MDFAVQKGQLVGLTGPGGAGKTTFVDAITPVVPYLGQMELDGRALDGLPAHTRAARELVRRDLHVITAYLDGAAAELEAAPELR